LTIPSPPRSTLFPYTTLFRSSTLPSVHPRPAWLPESIARLTPAPLVRAGQLALHSCKHRKGCSPQALSAAPWLGVHRLERKPRLDRKSTRLNSSHVAISYAVF